MELIYQKLNEVNVDVAICDGKTPKKMRQLLTTSLPGVLILQSQMGCEGLNLQGANEINIVSEWWNPGMENQAISRCHRIGQKK